MTRAGFDALDEELKQLKSVERPAVIRAIAEAREHGDLSENAEYHAAREKQSFIEGRIKELEGILSPGRGDRPVEALRRDQVRRDGHAGRRGHRRGKDLSDRRRDRGRYRAGLLNIRSPLARALIGKDEGDSVEVKTPGGPAQL